MTLSRRKHKLNFHRAAIFGSRVFLRVAKFVPSRPHGGGDGDAPRRAGSGSDPRGVRAWRAREAHLRARAAQGRHQPQAGAAPRPGRSNPEEGRLSLRRAPAGAVRGGRGARLRSRPARHPRARASGRQVREEDRGRAPRGPATGARG